MENPILQFISGLSIIYGNRLVDILQIKPAVQKPLLSMLRPLDIISLARATNFCNQPPAKERYIYILQWRQLFYHIKQIKLARRDIFVVGLDLIQLQGTIKIQHYFNGLEIKLLVLIKDHKSVILVPNIIPLDSTDIVFAYRYNYRLKLLDFTSAKLQQVQIVVILYNTSRFKIGVFVYTSEGLFIIQTTILY